MAQMGREPRREGRRAVVGFLHIPRRPRGAPLSLSVLLMLHNSRLCVVSSLCLLVACSGGGGSSGEPAPSVPTDPLLLASTGIERIQRFSHPSCAANSGVDAVRMPRFDAAVGEFRDDWLFVASGATGVYGVLVDDQWNVRGEAYWPVTGFCVVWSDVCATRIRDNAGR